MDAAATSTMDGDVKHAGDGIMASFPSAASAAQATVRIQRNLAGGAGGAVRGRVGLNAGDATLKGFDEPVMLYEVVPH